MLMAEAGGGGGVSNMVARLAGKINKGSEVPVTRVARALTHAWGGMFSAAEKYNRHVAFIAAWEVAPPEGSLPVRQGCGDGDAVRLHQGIAGQLGPRRGRCDALHLPHLHALVHRLPVEPAAPQRALALAVLFVFAGMSGMPGADDMDDIIDTIGQKLGYNWNNKADRHSWLVKTLGSISPTSWSMASRALSRSTCRPALAWETSCLDLVCSRSRRTTKAGKLLKYSELRAPTS